MRKKLLRDYSNSHIVRISSVNQKIKSQQKENLGSIGNHNLLSIDVHNSSIQVEFKYSDFAVNGIHSGKEYNI